MQNTPNLNLPYPEPTDPPDGAAQIKGLAEAIDGLAEPKLFVFSANTEKPVGANWQTAYQTTWDMPGPGFLLVIGEVELEDTGQVPGDCQTRLNLDGFDGPISVTGVTAGAQAVTFTVPVISHVSLSAAKTVQVIVQTGSTGSQNAGNVRNANLRGLYLPRYA